MGRFKNGVAARTTAVVLVSSAILTAAPPTTKQDGIPTGFMIVEGDIIVPHDFLSPTVAATYATNLWPGGDVPYAFDPNVSPLNRTATLNMMAAWEARADVRFRPREDDAHFLLIRSSTGNSSYVGRVGGGQSVNIVSWGRPFVIAHELGHALGFWHEQSRLDRDLFIQVHHDFVEPGREHNFNVRAAVGGEVGPYDFDSVMHYNRCAFSICGCSPGCETITVLPTHEKWQNRIGQRDHLSEWDGRGMAHLYGFSGPDCNKNHIRDTAELSSANDCNDNRILDECESGLDCSEIPVACCGAERKTGTESCLETSHTACIAMQGAPRPAKIMCPAGCPRCAAPCDWCWTGTAYQNACDTQWNGDGKCDCGCQFQDIDCPDCAADADCADFLFCNGEEKCELGVCQNLEGPCDRLQEAVCDEAGTACLAPGNFDSDADVDLDDFAILNDCTGQPTSASIPGCETGDIDGDGDVDFRDLSIWTARFTGP